jgi:hypothetical protein
MKLDIGEEVPMNRSLEDLGERLEVMVTRLPALLAYEAHAGAWLELFPGMGSVIRILRRGLYEP